MKAGERQGLGPWGTLDMAGNVKEWCVNESRAAGLRYILGGGWNEPSYRYSEADARNPWERRADLRRAAGRGRAGVRRTPPPRRSRVSTAIRRAVVPVSDELFEVYRRFYAYDRTPLDAGSKRSTTARRIWRKETRQLRRRVRRRARAGASLPAEERAPPYQTVMLLPERVRASASSSSSTLDLVDVRLHRPQRPRVALSVYQGTFERRLTRAQPVAPTRRRDMHVQWAKDFFRAVDYLETRPDIDTQRLGYYSLSMGGVLRSDPGVARAADQGRGVRVRRPALQLPPEIQPANFMPRVKMPVLLINGRDDFQAPLDHQQRFLELLGTRRDTSARRARRRTCAERSARRDSRSARLVRQTLGSVK